MPSVFHTPSIDLAVELQRRSKAKFDGQPDDIVRGALFILTLDAVAVHRGVGALVDAGWPAPAAALLRTSFDIGISAMAIVNSATPPMAAFRYFYSGFRRHSRDQRFPSAIRHRMFDQIRQRLASLPPTLRTEAMRVVREKDRPYWYGEEFATPATVLERFSSPEMVWVYAQLSGAAHGSFLGLRLYREDPDAITINPEPRGKRALMADFTFCRLLVDLCGVREAVEGLGLNEDLDRLRADILNAAHSMI